MPDTTNRPTPDDIADRIDYTTGTTAFEFLGILRQHGYVIVHPDDVPTTFPAPESLFGCTFEEAYEFGCRKMRAHIFGDDQ